MTSIPPVLTRGPTVPVCLAGAGMLLLVLPGPARGQEAPAVRITLEHGTEAESRMADELRAVLAKYDLEPWMQTRDIRIDERSIPHSHPVLTLRTHGVEVDLLSTFVHEQLHWLEEARPEPWAAAMRDFRRLFPEVPPASEGGARDDESAYRHLLVCDLEYQVMATLVGDAEARKTLAGITHYEWVYQRVLSDPRIRSVARRHGFDVRDGIPGR